MVEDDIHSIHIVPMTIPKNLGRLTTSLQYKRLLLTILKSLSSNETMIEEDASRILEMEKKLFGMRLPAYFYRGEFLTGSFNNESITIRELSSLVPEVS